MKYSINTELLSQPTKDTLVGEMTLFSELNKISKFRGNDAPEVIAFYAGRIVEAMVSTVIEDSKIPEEAKTVKNKLDVLSKHGIINEGTISIANAIRRYGNQVRHLERVIAPDEEETIVGLLQLWIEWFDNTHLLSQSNGSEISTDSWSSKTGILRQLAYPEAELFDSHIQHDDQREALLADAAIAEFAAQRLVDFQSEFADNFTYQVINKFPKSIRGKQVRALYFSRNGKPDSAIEILTELLTKLRKSRYITPDSETYGILGGAYKNKWIKDRNQEDLKSAQQYYQEGTEDYPTDYYLLINLAAISRWIGNIPESRVYAQRALQSLSKYGIVINTGDQCEGIDYWVIATLAEANLLAGKAKRSAYIYEQAKNLDTLGGRWNRTAQQLSLHLKSFSDQHTLQYFSALVPQ